MYLIVRYVSAISAIFQPTHRPLFVDRKYTNIESLLPFALAFSSSSPLSYQVVFCQSLYIDESSPISRLVVFTLIFASNQNQNQNQIQNDTRSFYTRLIPFWVAQAQTLHGQYGLTIEKDESQYLQGHLNW
jgi:hypothetical protein